MVRRSVFDQIFNEIRTVRFRLDDIEKTLTQKQTPITISNSALLSLPDHLRRTYLIVASKGECNAQDVSCQTGRSRAIESNYLNQLVIMQWLHKQKTHRITMFKCIPIKEGVAGSKSLLPKMMTE